MSSRFSWDVGPHGLATLVRRIASTAAAIAAIALGPLPGRATEGLYVKRPSLQATLLATRAALAGWQASQDEARAAVKIGPWGGVSTKDRAKFTPAQFSRSGVLPAAAAKAALPQWNPWAADGSGGLFSVETLPADYLAVTITAQRPVTLTFELSRYEWFGGFAYRPPANGAGLDPAESLIWLNGNSVKLDNLLDGYARVSVAKRRSWHERFALHETVLVRLSLQRGENHLVAALDKGQRKGWFNTVRLFSRPAPALWAMIEHDFPRSQNRLLESVAADWFDADSGWFSQAKDTRRERELLKRLAEQIGPDGATIARRAAELSNGNAPAADPRWLDLCVTAAELDASLRDAKALQSGIDALATGFASRYPGAALAARLKQWRTRALTLVATRFDPADAAGSALLAEFRQLQRDALVTHNPLLAQKTLLFVKRYTYDSDHYYDEFNQGIRRFGGGLYTLSMADGRVAPVAPALHEGLVDRYDLSFDGRRIALDYKPPRPEGFRLYEVGIDGSGLRQITFPPDDEPQRIAAYSVYPPEELRRNPWRYGHWTDDMHPCYLPDGGIAFTSTRTERSVLCGGHTLTVTNLHRINADGSGMTRLSQGALSEFCPSVMNDGRLLYNRWEYVDKGAGAVQSLWAMFPDGTRSEAVYGSNITTPPVFNQARHIPGSNHQIVCLGAGHCPGNMGAIVLVDLHKNKRTSDAMTVLTPGTLPKGNWALRQFRNGRWLMDIYGPWYCDPYPLTETAAPSVAGKFYLVSCNAEGMWNDPAGYGLYLLDAFGNRVPLYADREFSCWQARPLAPRTTPPVLAGSVTRVAMQPATPPQRVATSANAISAARARGEATLMVADVYQGLPGVPRGSVKYLRVMEQVARPWSVYQGYQGNDSSPGQMVAISLYTHLSVKVLHGVVPVREDGSAFFVVPAGKNLFLAALDGDYMEVQRMRTFVNLQPGEERSCIGCHEHRNRAPVSRLVAAMTGPPSRPQAQPGEVAPRPLHYPTDVQPIFDRHCVSCHSSKRADGGLNLDGEMTELFCRSYEDLIKKDLVGYIQEFIGPKPEGADAMGYAAAVGPYTYGAHKSKLISALRVPHYDVKLSREEMIRLTTWVDANAPYYGSYFGRRNLAHRNRPDFRPVPTLESAQGCPTGVAGGAAKP